MWNIFHIYLSVLFLCVAHKNQSRNKQQQVVQLKVGALRCGDDGSKANANRSKENRLSHGFFVLLRLKMANGNLKFFLFGSSATTLHRRSSAGAGLGERRCSNGKICWNGYYIFLMNNSCAVPYQICSVMCLAIETNSGCQIEITRE